MDISRITVGRLEVIGIADARPAPVDPVRSYPDVTREDWAPHRQWLTPDGSFQPDLGCFVVRGPQGVILIDAGIGPGPVAYLGDARGSLRRHLDELGIRFADVAAVLFTHLHFDHVGWASLPDATGAMRPSFPNARYVVGRSEWAFWTASPQTVMAHHRDAFERVVRPVATAGQLVIVDDGATPLDGFSYRRLPGNTPSHQGIMATSSGARCLFAADLCHCPAQVSQWRWSHRSDVDPAAGRATRHAVFSELADSGTLLAFGHFPRGVDFGEVRGAIDAWRWAPIATRD